MLDVRALVRTAHDSSASSDRADPPDSGSDGWRLLRRGAAVTPHCVFLRGDHQQRGAGRGPVRAHSLLLHDAPRAGPHPPPRQGDERTTVPVLRRDACPHCRCCCAHDRRPLWALPRPPMPLRLLGTELSAHIAAPPPPHSQFVCIKAIVFFAFWQGVLISILTRLGIVSPAASWNTYTDRDVANGLQDALICVEMLVAAIAHAFVFPPRDYYTDDPPPSRGFVGGLKQLLDWNDVWEDATQNVADYTRETHAEVRRRVRRGGGQRGEREGERREGKSERRRAERGKRSGGAGVGGTDAIRGGLGSMARMPCWERKCTSQLGTAVGGLLMGSPETRHRGPLRADPQGDAASGRQRHQRGQGRHSRPRRRSAGPLAIPGDPCFEAPHPTPHRSCKLVTTLCRIALSTSTSLWWLCDLPMPQCR